MATINDVCTMAGVSKATVSRVLNNPESVTQLTRQRVLKAISSLNYHPSSVARALATRSSNSIGLIVPDFEGAYYGALLQQANASCEHYGKQLVMTRGANNPDKEQEAITMLINQRCDAIVLYSRSMPEEKIKAISQTVKTPIVTINRKFHHPELACITFDQFGAGYMSTQYLIQHEHTHIACITGTVDTPTGSERLRGFRQAMSEHGLDINPQAILSGNFNFEGGYDACNSLIQKNIAFTALVACSDEMAVGAQKALIENGYRIPNDISVIGIDDARMAKYAHVPLTTIHIPIKNIMQCAIDMAIQLIDDPQSITPTQFVGELIERKSVGIRPS